MLTVQEIQALTFEKAMFNGYDPKSVDEVIEQITEDYAAMQKENAALKAKMKVLVDKIDEYRSVEDGMRRALVSAQGIAQETLDKAKLESQQIVDEAKVKYEMRVKELKAEIAAEEQRLELAKKNNADFLSKMTAVYDAQKRFWSSLQRLRSCSPPSRVTKTILQCQFRLCRQTYRKLLPRRHLCRQTIRCRMFRVTRNCPQMRSSMLRCKRKRNLPFQKSTSPPANSSRHSSSKPSQPTPSVCMSRQRRGSILVS